ncbi:putative 28S ribosomal protein S16, mitochondrial, partial [Trichinella nelsoni]
LHLFIFCRPFNFCFVMFKHALTLARFGCRNRPFFHIVVAKCKTRRWQGDIIEQVGTYDPLPNEFNEKLVALDFNRVRYWLGQDIAISRSVLELLGLSGLLPIHPYTYLRSRQNRRNPLLIPYFEKNGMLQNMQQPTNSSG